MNDDRSWTDDELREAVATSITYRQVMRAIGLAPGSLVYLKKQIARLGLDTSHFDSHPKKKLCSDDELRELVRTSTSGTEVLARLGMEPRRSHFTKLNRRLDELNLDTSHFKKRGRPNKRNTRWREDQLRDAVANSTSVAQTIRALGLIPAGGNYDQVQRKIRELHIDTSHFLGSRWSKGRKLPFMPVIPLEDLLVAGSETTSHLLKKRLFRAGLKKPACELCGWAECRPCDGVIPVELDHINGDKTDNRLVNLRVVCPNCHSLQPTHRALNKKSCRPHRASENYGTPLSEYARVLLTAMSGSRTNRPDRGQLTVAPVGFEPTLR
jgi:hypothetical protein